MTRGIALVRRPSPLLADGILTHLTRTPVDVDLALRQHAAYVSAVAGAGWEIREVEPADDCPDAVFVEDTVVILGDLAVLARSGAPARRPEVVGTMAAVTALGLRTASIEEPGTLDGGDVLQVGLTVYAGLGGRTNAEGIRQLGRHAETVGRTVVAIPLTKVLHLKSAVTALPDGTFLIFEDLVDPSHFSSGRSGPSVRQVPEEPGAHVVLLGNDELLIAASAPRTAALVADLGYRPVIVDITEFERLEGCVTCLNVLIPAVAAAP